MPPQPRPIGDILRERNIEIASNDPIVRAGFTLVAYLKAGIAADKFPFAPRLKPIKSVLAELYPPKPRMEKPEIPSAPMPGKTMQRR